MQIIKKMSELIDEELDAAERYIKCANKYKMEYPTLSRTFATLCENEMQHSNILHSEVIKIIDRYRTEQGEPPADMMAIYEYVHDRQIEWAADIKRLQDLYNK